MDTIHNLTTEVKKVADNHKRHPVPSDHHSFGVGFMLNVCVLQLSQPCCRDLDYPPPLGCSVPDTQCIKKN